MGGERKPTSRRKLRKDSKFYGKEDEVIALYKGGKSTHEIGEMFGVDHSNIFRFLKWAGVTRNQQESIQNAIKTGRMEFPRGEESHSWRGGKTRHSSGYILIKQPQHPRANKQGYVPEQILVMERMLGRSLKPKETVHHDNSVEDDNREENLVLLSNSQEHHRLHAELAGGKIGINSPKGRENWKRKTGRERLSQIDAVEKQKERIFTLHITGLSTGEIATELGFTTAGIRACLQHHGKKIHSNIIRKKYNILRKHRKKVISQYRAGASLTVISNEYNVSTDTIRRFLHDEPDVSLRSYREAMALRNKKGKKK